MHWDWRQRRQVRNAGHGHQHCRYCPQMSASARL